MISADIYYRKMHIEINDDRGVRCGRVKGVQEGGQVTSCSHLRATRRSEDLARALAHSRPRLQHTVTLDRSLTRTHARTPAAHSYIDSCRASIALCPAAHRQQSFTRSLVNDQSISTLIALAYRQASAIRRLPRATKQQADPGTSQPPRHSQPERRVAPGAC